MLLTEFFYHNIIVQNSSSCIHLYTVNYHYSILYQSKKSNNPNSQRHKTLILRTQDHIFFLEFKIIIKEKISLPSVPTSEPFMNPMASSKAKRTVLPFFSRSWDTLPIHLKPVSVSCRKISRRVWYLARRWQVSRLEHQALKIIRQGTTHQSPVLFGDILRAIQAMEQLVVLCICRECGWQISGQESKNPDF